MSTIDYDKQNFLERPHCSSNEQKTQAIERIGLAVNSAVERFIAVGEIIAEDNPEIKSEMYESCKEARKASNSIQRLCQISMIDEMQYVDIASSLCDQEGIVLASRSLLSSITRILLLVDIVVVKQLISAKKKIARSLKNLESVVNFTEFVRAFSVFGIEMVELAYLTGVQPNALKEERRRAQMLSARQILERSVTILLTSSKMSLVHGDCMMAKENRDTVFCQIRRAMDLIHFVVKDSLLDSACLPRSRHQQQSSTYKAFEKDTVYSALKHFTYLMESFRLTAKYIERTVHLGNNNFNKYNGALDDWSKKYSNQRNYLQLERESDPNLYGNSTGNNYMLENFKNPMWMSSDSLPLITSKITEQLVIAFDKLLEKTHDLTDSPYTSQENRENILLLCERCKIELNKYLNNIFRSEQLIDEEIDVVLGAVKNLTEQLVLSVTDQAAELYHSLEKSVELVASLHTFVVKQDLEYLHERSNQFHDYCDHIIEVCKLLQHIAFTETLQVKAKCLAINLRIYAPQVLTAAKVLSKYPSSIPANENFDAFVEMWKWLIAEITGVAKQILHSTNELNLPEKPNKPTTTSLKPYVPVKTEQDKNTFNAIDDIKTAPADVPVPTDKWNDDLNDNNDILKRAKNMSAMAFSMYQFTKGQGILRTTQDLFTQAEYFAEEANRLYKVLRQFSYQVPASNNKKDLLGNLDRVPTFVQTLQFTVKDHTVGKAATFEKVDHVIRETRNLMNLINKVVNKCFECADKYKLDFSVLSGGLNSGAFRGDDSSAGGVGDSKGTTNSTEGSM